MTSTTTMLSVKLPNWEAKERLRLEAEKRDVSVSALVREAIGMLLAKEEFPPPRRRN